LLGGSWLGLAAGTGLGLADGLWVDWLPGFGRCLLTSLLGLVDGSYLACWMGPSWAWQEAFWLGLQDGFYVVLTGGL